MLKLGEEHVNGADHALGDRGGPVPTALNTKKRKRKYRKSTHAILKGEKEELLVEISALRTRLEDLKVHTFGTVEEEEEKDRLCKEKMVANRVLRRAVRVQQDELTSVHALVNEYSLSDTEAGSALHRFIHLKKNGRSRRAALAAMKCSALSRGNRLLQSRRPRLHHPWQSQRNDHCFEASTGDYYASSFAVMPFQHFNSVQRAFESLIVYFGNLEISRSENFGSVTIREDNDSFDDGIAQNRLVTTTLSGLHMESNTVFFSKYVDKGDDVGQQRGYGLIVCEHVDEDDRYPFHPNTRVRRDISSVLEVGSYMRREPTPARSTPTVNANEQVVVVLTRWVHTRLHYPSFDIQPDHWHEMRENTERWIQLLQPVLLETLV